jgi:integrase
MRKEKLERGIRRRGVSLVAYLTHPDGRIERRSMGNVGAKMAATQRAIWQRAIQEGKYIRPVPRAEKVLFSTIADAALEHAKTYKRHWDTDAGRIARMKQWWTGRTADSITTKEIDDKLLETLRAEDWSETTSNEYRVLISHVYTLAINDGKLSVNPAAKAHRYKLSNARTRELSEAEEIRLRQAIRENYPAKEPEFDLALHTGARRSNLFGIHGKGRKEMVPLDWRDVNLDWKVINFSRAKDGPGYTVPVNETALAALRTLRERAPDGTGPVIRKASGLEIHSCRKWFEQCLAKAAIANFRWHDLRHTFGTRLRRNGVPLEDIALLLDHSIPELRMTARYAHADIEKLRKAVATLDKTDTKTDTPAVIEFPQAKAV